jgi:hypothetical protein
VFGADEFVLPAVEFVLATYAFYPAMNFVTYEAAQPAVNVKDDAAVPVFIIYTFKVAACHRL